MIHRKSEGEIMDVPAEARAYAQADFSGVNQAFVDRLIELAAPLVQKKVLAMDLGTGPGDIPVRLIKTLACRTAVRRSSEALTGPLQTNWRIVAVDASAVMLDFARQLVHREGLSKTVELVLADAKDTRLQAGTFDIVFSNSILHHVSDPGAFWREVKRVAKPNALVFLRDLARPESEAAARAIVNRYAGGGEQLLQDEYYRSLLAAYTVQEVREQLAAAGLEMLRAEMVTDRHMDVWGRV